MTEQPRPCHRSTVGTVERPKSTGNHLTAIARRDEEPPSAGGRGGRSTTTDTLLPTPAGLAAIDLAVRFRVVAADDTATSTGFGAAELARHLEVMGTDVDGRACTSWREVTGVTECHNGCRLYVRLAGPVLHYLLLHSTSFGCELGGHAVTADVPVIASRRTHALSA